MFYRLAQRSLQRIHRSTTPAPLQSLKPRAVHNFHTLRRPTPLPQALPSLRNAQQHRSISMFSMADIRRHKIIFGIFGGLIAVAIGSAVYYAYLFNELIDKPLSRYPAPVAQQVKSALYYASQNNPAKMTSHFKKAIAQAEESGMHPLSDEIAGLKIECAALLAKLGDGQHKSKAVDILEHVLDENAAGAEYFGKEKRWEDRGKVLKRAVLLGYKVGELYTELNKTKQAEEALVWSTETMLREVQRRAHEKDNIGEWFGHAEVAGCLEKLADHYEATSQHVLAAPLYLRAVTLMPASNKDCHALTVMTNLSASLCQQNPPAGAGITREQMIQDAEKWAKKVLELDANMTPPERTSECDEACLVATHNLGEMAEMLGNTDEAMKRYVEARSLAKGLGMEEGVQRAQDGLDRLAAKLPAAKAN